MKTVEDKAERKEEVGNIWKTHIPYVPFAFGQILDDKYIHKYHGSTSRRNAWGLGSLLQILF